MYTVIWLLSWFYNVDIDALRLVNVLDLDTNDVVKHKEESNTDLNLNFDQYTV